jgi:hypothetical protein
VVEDTGWGVEPVVGRQWRAEGGSNGFLKPVLSPSKTWEYLWRSDKSVQLWVRWRVCEGIRVDGRWNNCRSIVLEMEVDVGLLLHRQ